MAFTATTKEAFLSKLDRSGDCWLWTGSLDKDGYGKTSINYKHWKTHRASWNYFVGPIPEGMSVLHKCDVRACCNPEHLWLGTQKDNLRDMFAKGRGRPRGKG